jgi:hypothetical protein
MYTGGDAGLAGKPPRGDCLPMRSMADRINSINVLRNYDADKAERSSCTEA